MKEVWRAVVDYEGYYEVSNWGRVRSLSRFNRRGQNIKGVIFHPHGNGYGYLHVGLTKEGQKRMYYVHRLVAEAFLPNPNSLPCVNHKDENKENNFVFVREDGSVDFSKSNLEWCTYEYNINYGTARERQVKVISKPVYQYTLNGEFVREWPSANEVHRQTGWSLGNICSCCNGKRKSAYGYIWSYTKKAENF